ncbi:hypothetical protein HY642_06100 [Candidatus Woesearchaeota archaeon]|nr:hypothetical protein [Candidatus Woesearchaeota archaeon]
MLTPEERKRVHQQLDELTKEIKELRQKLGLSDNQRKQLLRERSAIGRQISHSIHDMKEQRTARNQFTTDVKSAKEKRDAFNKLIKERLAKLKELNEQKQEIAAKYGIKQDPATIKKTIERMNYVLETEVVSFEKEKQLMKTIRELERSYQQALKVSDIWDRAHAVAKEVDQLRAEANSLHKHVQDAAGQSQQRHEAIVSDSTHVDELRAKERAVEEQIIAVEQQMSPLESQLAEKQKLANELDDKLGNERKEQRNIKEQEQKKKLSNRKQEAEEKFRRGEKLTTEDILALQAQ